MNSTPLRTIADRSGVSKTSLIRHRDAHLSEVVVNSQQAQERARGDVLVSVAVGLMDRALSLLGQAEAAQDVRGATAAMRETRSCIELLSKLKPEHQFTDELTPSPLQMAQWTEIAAREFKGRPRLADEFAHDLAHAIMQTVGQYVPRLRPGARERLVAKFEALDPD